MRRLRLVKSPAAKQWPTLLMLAIVYTTFAALLSGLFSAYPLIAMFFLAIVLTLHSSLQHEIIHGHPFKSQWLNDSLVLMPIGVFVPYHRFRDTHLAHHVDTHLTDPYDDPETAYHDRSRWQAYSRSYKALLVFNTTLVGRMLVGPAIGMIAFYRDDLQFILKGNKQIFNVYVYHVAALAVLLPLLHLYSQVHLLHYLTACYLCMSLLKIRTYAEHKAHESVPGRIAIVESRGPLGWLFLFNNYHSVHHRFPRLAWFQLPGLFEKERDHWLQKNHNNHFESYGVIFKHFLFRAREPVVHPLWSADKRNKSTAEHSHTEHSEESAQYRTIGK